MQFKKIDKSLVSELVVLGDQEILIVCNYLKNIVRLINTDTDLGQVCLKLARNGIVEAEYTISNIFRWGLMCQQNKEQALYWCQRSVKKNYAPALLLLSNFYSTGWPGIKINFRKSFELAEKAASKNFIPAIVTLGSYYREGYCINKNTKKAIWYYQKAAELGDNNAMWCLSIILLKDPNFKDESEGLKWFGKAINKGSPFAHSTLAYFHMGGKYGFRKDKSLFEYHIKMEASLNERMVKSCLKGLS